MNLPMVQKACMVNELGTSQIISVLGTLSCLEAQERLQRYQHTLATNLSRNLEAALKSIPESLGRLTPDEIEERVYKVAEAIRNLE